MEDTAEEDAGHQTGKACGAEACDGGDHHRHERKGSALHDRQARADHAEADGLEERRDTGEEHRHLDHVGHVREAKGALIRAKANASSASNQNGGGDVRDEHGQHVLDAERHSFGHRRGVVWIAELLRRSD